MSESIRILITDDHAIVREGQRCEPRGTSQTGHTGVRSVHEASLFQQPQHGKERMGHP